MSLQLGRTEFGDPINKDKVYTRAAAFQLFNEWVLNPKLQLHMLQVAHLMKNWAAEKEVLNEADQWKWEMAGLLHDADWDQWPTLHCKKIIEKLEADQIDPAIIHAIAAHGPIHFGVTPSSNMDKMLFAFDELSGLIHAYALMRPGGYEGMDVKGVKKRLKDKAFAANVSREDITEACRLANIDLDQLIDFIITRQADCMNTFTIDG